MASSASRVIKTACFSLAISACAELAGFGEILVIGDDSAEGGAAGDSEAVGGAEPRGGRGGAGRGGHGGGGLGGTAGASRGGTSGNSWSGGDGGDESKAGESGSAGRGGTSGAAPGSAGESGSQGDTGGVPNSMGGNSGTAGSAGSSIGGDAGTPGGVSCGAGQAKNPKSGTCRVCSINCTETGSRGLYPLTTEDGRCVCETEEGYFYEIGASIGAYPCDADEDGWVRDSARSYVESDDVALHENARCTLRRVSEVVLENENADQYSLYFTRLLDVTSDPTRAGGHLPLYESVRNDDAVRLAAEPIAVPMLGERSLSVTELNGFTKACVSGQSDHNDNGRKDVEEWGRLPGGQSDVPLLYAGRDDFLPIYTRFSFFVELHVGGFELESEDPEQRTETGRYRVRERSRDPLADAPIGLVGDPNLAGEYWRDCERRRDSEYTSDRSPVTNDFASLSGPELTTTPWEGMRHHSQFKCVEVVLARSSDDEPLHRQSATSLAREGWTVNRCELGAASAPDAKAGKNPSFPDVACSAGESGDVTVGDVLWTETGFWPYEDALAGYRRGCVDECTEGIVLPDECYRCTPREYGEAMISVSAPGASCSGGVCDGAGNCGDCVPGRLQCRGLSVQQRCDDNGDWQDVTTCQFDCEPSTGTCGCFRDVPAGVATTCETATDVGSLDVGDTFEVVGRIPNASTSHWYFVTIPEPRTDAGFVVRLDPARTGASFRIEVMQACGLGSYSCNLYDPPAGNPRNATNITTWEFKDDCGTRCPAAQRVDLLPKASIPKSAYLRVYRTDTAVSCEPYALTFRRP